jgi:hypothetical protein
MTMTDSTWNPTAWTHAPDVLPDAPGGLFLSRDGIFYQDGQRVRHARLAALLSRSIARDEAGALMVTTGRDRVRLSVEDAPFVVVRFYESQDPQAPPEVLSSTGRRDPLVGAKAPRLVLDQEGVLHSTVGWGPFWARWTRTAWEALFPHIKEREGAHFAVFGQSWLALETPDMPPDFSAAP